MPNNPLNSSVEDLKKWQESVNKSAEQAEDVKEGRCTAEEERKEPGYILYNQIAETSVKLLQLPEVTNAFSSIAKSVGEETSKLIVELMAITMTQSAYQAVCFYDDLLKEELTKHFQQIGECLNITRADVAGHGSALAVFRKQLNEIQNKMKTEEFAKANNITQPEE